MLYNTKVICSWPDNHMFNMLHALYPLKATIEINKVPYVGGWCSIGLVFPQQHPAHQQIRIRPYIDFPVFIYYDAAFFRTCPGSFATEDLISIGYTIFYLNHLSFLV